MKVSLRLEKFTLNLIPCLCPKYLNDQGRERNVLQKRYEHYSN